MLNSFDHQAMLENVNEAKNNLLQLCAGELAEFGFEPKVRGQAVYRTTATGKWAFHLNFRDRVYGFEVMASVAVRLDEVEDLVNHYPLNDLLSNSDRKKTFTVGTNFRVGGAPPLWEVEFDHETPQIADSITSLVKQEGISFLEINSTLEGALATLISDPTEGRRTLVISFLLRNQTLFNEIAEKERIRLENKNDASGFEKFRILEEELRRRGFD